MSQFVLFSIFALKMVIFSQPVLVKIEKDKLLDFVDVPEAEFNKIYTSMNELCFGKFSLATNKLNNVLTEKRRREEEEELSDLEGEEEDCSADVVVPGLKKSKKRQKQEDYDSWKEKVLSAPKQELPTNVWRQSSIFNFVKTYVNRLKDGDDDDQSSHTETTSTELDVSITNPSDANPSDANPSDVNPGAGNIADATAQIHDGLTETTTKHKTKDTRMAMKDKSDAKATTDVKANTGPNSHSQTTSSDHVLENACGLKTVTADDRTTETKTTKSRAPSETGPKTTTTKDGGNTDAATGKTDAKTKDNIATSQTESSCPIPTKDTGNSKGHERNHTPSVPCTTPKALSDKTAPKISSNKNGSPKTEDSASSTTGLQKKPNKTTPDICVGEKTNATRPASKKSEIDTTVEPSDDSPEKPASKKHSDPTTTSKFPTATTATTATAPNQPKSQKYYAIFTRAKKIQ